MARPDRPPPAAAHTIEAPAPAFAPAPIPTRIPTGAGAAVRAPASARAARAARALPVSLDVVRVPGGVAVVADSFHYAFKARDALKITWKAGPLAGVSDAQIRSRLKAAVPALGAPPRGSTQIEARFEFAFVSHAPMEVLTAVADVRARRAEIWFSSQTPMEARESIAEAVGLPGSAVKVHVMRGGGSFGRRLNYDAAIEAALVSKAAGRPVKLMWSRADDLRHGRMRPASQHRIRASHDRGRVVAFAHATASVSESYSGITTASFRAAAPLPSDSGLYNFGKLSGDSGSVELAAIPLGAWRSVDSGTVRTAEEIVVDEIARGLGKDPVAFRRTTLRSKAVKAVLDKVATAGDWGRTMPGGQAQGVAVHEEYGSCVACLVEIDAADPKNPRVTKVVMAADVGTAVNPRGLEAQLMGTAIDGISTILRAGLHIDKGAVREGSYADFRYARQRHAPLHFEAHILPTGGEPGGAGELGVPAAAGAVANAYARATGTKPRRFPIDF